MCVCMCVCMHAYFIQFVSILFSSHTDLISKIILVLVHEKVIIFFLVFILIHENNTHAYRQIGNHVCYHFPIKLSIICPRLCSHICTDS